MFLADARTSLSTAAASNRPASDPSSSSTAFSSVSSVSENGKFRSRSGGVVESGCISICQHTCPHTRLQYTPAYTWAN